MLRPKPVAYDDLDRRQQSLRLDALRGLAAFLVVVAHARDKLADVQVPNGGIVEKLLLGPTAFGQEAVAVFFVLSGYLVGGQALRQISEDRFAWGVYLAKRLSRLWTVLLPGLLLSGLLEFASNRLNPTAFHLLVHESRRDLGTLLCNAAFLSPTHCDSYGSNWSLWSLAYEFWFYISFAAATWAVFGLARRRWARVWVGLAVTVGVVALFGVSIVPYMVSWLMGVVVAHIVRVRPRPIVTRTPMVLGASAVVMSMVATTALHLSKVSLQIVVGVAASFLVYALVSSVAQGQWLGLTERAAQVGGWSYSMYVFHFPLIVLAMCAAAPVVSHLSGWRVAIVYGLAVVAAAITYFLSLVTERHTGTVRGWLLKVLDQRHSARIPWFSRARRTAD